MTIGLRRHTVRLVEHDPEWLDLWAEACRKVREAAGDLIVDVQHVGSTAVPGLVAKPILDLAACVESMDVIPDLSRRLSDIGYIDRGDRGESGGYLFVMDSEPEVRVIHLHVVACDDPQWDEYLIFRDRLRRDPELCQKYMELKRRLSVESEEDRVAYTDGKAEFIREVLRGEEDALCD